LMASYWAERTSANGLADSNALFDLIRRRGPGRSSCAVHSEFSPWGEIDTEESTVTGTGGLRVLRLVAANASDSCALDISNASLAVKPPGTPQP